MLLNNLRKRSLLDDLLGRYSYLLAILCDKLRRNYLRGLLRVYHSVMHLGQTFAELFLLLDS